MVGCNGYCVGMKVNSTRFDMKFKSLPAGAKFQFAGDGRVWRKYSARQYRLVGDSSILGGLYKIESVNVDADPSHKSIIDLRESLAALASLRASK